MSAPSRPGQGAHPSSDQGPDDRETKGGSPVLLTLRSPCGEVIVRVQITHRRPSSHPPPSSPPSSLASSAPPPPPIARPVLSESAALMWDLLQYLRPVRMDRSPSFVQNALRTLALHTGSQMDASETLLKVCDILATSVTDLCTSLSPVLLVDVQECASDASESRSPLASFHSTMAVTGTLGELRAHDAFCASLFRDKARLPPVLRPDETSTLAGLRAEIANQIHVNFLDDETASHPAGRGRPVHIDDLVSRVWLNADRGIVSVDKDREVDTCPTPRAQTLYRYMDIPFDFLDSDDFDLAASSPSGATPSARAARPVGHVVPDPGFMNVTEHAFACGRYAVIHFKNGGLDARKVFFSMRVPLRAQLPTAPSTTRAFSLVSAVIHTGSRGGGGHYTALVNADAFVPLAATSNAERSGRGGKPEVWARLNDDHATRVAASDVSRQCFSPNESTPLLLIYRRDDQETILGDLDRLQDAFRTGDDRAGGALARKVRDVRRHEERLRVASERVGEMGSTVSKRIHAWLNGADGASGARGRGVHPRMRNIGNSCHFNAVANAWFLFAPEILALTPRLCATGFIFVSPLVSSLTRGLDVEEEPVESAAAPAPAEEDMPAWTDRDVATLRGGSGGGPYSLRAIWIDEVGVARDMRGKHIARQLFARACHESVVELKGLDQVHLLVKTTPERKEARRLYASLGFRRLSRACREYHFKDRDGTRGVGLRAGAGKLAYYPDDDEEYLVVSRALLLKRANRGSSALPRLTVHPACAFDELSSALQSDVKAIYDDAHADPSDDASFEGLRDATHVTVAVRRGNDV